MSDSILLALSGRARIFNLLLPLAVVTLGVFAIVRVVRWFILPIDDADLQAAFAAGVASFLVAGLCGAVAAMRMHQLRSCPFTANLPGVERRALREYRMLGGALVGVAAIAGPITLAADESSAHAVSELFVPLMAALGYGVGLVNNDPRERGWRPWQVIPWMLALTPLIFSVEIAQLTSRGALGWLAAACGVMLLAIEATGTAETGRVRSAARPRAALWTGDDLDFLHGTRGESTTSRLGRHRTESRSGSVGVASKARHATLRTDWQWASALLHEIYGFQRGGWFRTTAIFTVVVLAMAAGMLVAHGVVSGKGSTDGEELRSAVMRLDVLSGKLGLGQTILLTAFMASFFAICVLGAPLRSALSPLHPLSRLRRARVVWLATQAQEWTILAVAFVTLAVTSIAFALFTDVPTFHLWRQAAPIITAIVMMIPLARWARLRMIEEPGKGINRVELGTAGQTVAYAAVTLPLVIGAVLLMLLWITARAWSAPIGAMVAVASVAVFFGVRWWWFERLRRHFSQCDL